MDLILSRDGNTVRILPKAGAKLSAPVINLLDNTLSYQRKTCDFKGTAKFTKERMYDHDIRSGMLYTSLGLAKRAYGALKRSGHTITYLDNTPKDLDKRSFIPNWDCVADLSFRPRQRECLEAISKSIDGIIVAPTGFGKTFLIGALGRLYPNARIHVCTKSVDIARRIYKDLERMLHNVGMIGGGSHDTTARVTVITADSLTKSPGDCDFFFFDECHQAAAETYTEAVLNIYRYARRYGFTATPRGRSDKADDVLNLLFGEPIFNISYQEGVDLGLVVPIHVRWLTCNVSKKKTNKYQPTMTRKRASIWTNEDRNLLIANDVRNHTADGSILILVETIEHAVNLWKYLPDFQLCYSDMSDEDLQGYISCGLLPEDYTPMTKKDRHRLSDDFASGKVTKVIATDVWSTGVDFPSLAQVYSVSGRVSKILTTQGAGRVSRLFQGKDHGNVVDVQDTFNEEFSAYSKVRYKTYKDLNWKQEGFRW